MNSFFISDVFYNCKMKSYVYFHYTLKPLFHCDTKPYMLSPGVGFDPQRHNFALPIPTCWYLNMLKFALPPTRMLKFALPPTPTPNVSQWNIVALGTQCNIFTLAMYISFFVLISFAFGSQHKPSFQWNMGFRVQGLTAIAALFGQQSPNHPGL